MTWHGVSPLESGRRFLYEGAAGATGQLGRGSMRSAESATMDIGETLYVTSPTAFRRWLRDNHDRKAEIWLIQYKVRTGKASIDYARAVEEAICFGWVDGFVKSMDAERYATRFTPRRAKSHWSNSNMERAKSLISQGKMTEAGRAKLPAELLTTASGSRESKIATKRTRNVDGEPHG